LNCLDSEDVGDENLQNIGSYLPIDTAFINKRLESS